MALGNDGRPRQQTGIGRDHAIAPAELGVVERGISAGQNLIHGVARPSLAHADTPGERDAVLAGVERPRREPQAQILGNLDRLQQRLAFQREGELIAAERPVTASSRRAALAQMRMASSPASCP